MEGKKRNTRRKFLIFYSLFQLLWFPYGKSPCSNHKQGLGFIRTAVLPFYPDSQDFPQAKPWHALEYRHLRYGSIAVYCHPFWLHWISHKVAIIVKCSLKLRQQPSDSCNFIRRFYRTGQFWIQSKTIPVHFWQAKDFRCNLCHISGTIVFNNFQW